MPKLDASNIEDFMKENILKVPTDISNAAIPYVDAAAKTVWAKVASGFPSVLDGGEGKVFFLEHVPVNKVTPDCFLIYWVEYEADGKGVATWLGHDATLMFTAIMSGCSFGLGSQTPDGVRAAHVNSMSKSESGVPDDAQLRSQHKKLEKLGLTAREITPDIYLPGPFDAAVKTTPFGFRPQLKGGMIPARGQAVQSPGMSLPWKFCWQKYRVMGKNVTHMGVAQHAGGLF
jgi:hypothetical protein